MFVGLHLPLFTPHRSPRSFQHKLLKGKPYYFYYLPVLCSSPATIASSSLRPCFLATLSTSLLHAHQACRTSQANGEEIREEQVVGRTASTLTDGDLAKARKEGFLAESAEVVFPSTEVIPTPQPRFRVMFLAFLLHGLSLPAHKFLCGLLFIYSVQLHQLTPNSILHIACFITLCEAFLGINPHWGLWKYLFCLYPNASKEEVHDFGGAIISV
jgi:hypothetical protein